MVFSYDPNTDVGKVRLLIADIDEPNALFQNEDIEAFLDMEGDNVKLAAATAKHTIATSEALVSKVIRTKDLQTDGAKLAAELRAQAQQLRDEARQDDDDEGFFDIVDFNPYPPTTLIGES